MPATRSDSLCRSSPGPADRSWCRTPRRRPGTGPGSRRSPPPRRRRTRSTARSGADRTTRSARGSPSGPAARRGVSSMAAPMRRRMSMMARRVGFVLTPSRRSSASGWIERGDQPERRAGRVGGDGLVEAAAPGRAVEGDGVRAVRSDRSPTATPAGAQHPLGVVAGRDRLGHASSSPSAASAASRIADLTWALGTAVRWSMARRRAAPVIASGSRVPPSPARDPRAHRAQRLRDPRHRAPPERGVAVEDRGQRRARRGARRAGGRSSRSCRSRAPASGSVSASPPGDTTR